MPDVPISPTTSRTGAAAPRRRASLRDLAQRHPRGTAFVLFAVLATVLLGLVTRDLAMLRGRAWRQQERDIALRASNIDTSVRAGVGELQFLRSTAEQVMAQRAGAGLLATESALAVAYAARNAPEWSMPVAPGGVPVVGVGPAMLEGMPGFARRDADLPSDLFMVRLFSEVLGHIVDQHPFTGRAVFVSANGLYSAVPPLAGEAPSAALRRMAARPYFRDALPDRNPRRAIVWGPPEPDAASGQPVVGFGVPVYVDNRFRGVVISYVQLRYLLQLQARAGGQDEPTLLFDAQGDVLGATGIDTHAQARLLADLRAAQSRLDPATEAGMGLLPDGSTYLYRRVPTPQWLLVDPVVRGAGWWELLRTASPMLVASSVLVVVLLGATLRMAVVLFRQQLLLQEHLRDQARRDPLTGLANRRRFDEVLARAGAEGVGRDRPLALVALDIDHFKRINDNWGHATGDAVLRALAAVCTENVRGSDVVARLGGEEFAVVMPGAPLADAVSMAERLRAAVEAMHCVPVDDAGRPLADGAPILVTASFGVAECQADGLASADALLPLADRRLYAAKTGGRNRVVGR